MKEIIKVEEPNLVAFVARIQELVKQGYEVCDTNSGVPSSWGPGLYICEMEREAAEAVKVKEPAPEVAEVPAEAKIPEPEEKLVEVKPTTTKRRKTSSKSQ